MTAYRFDDDGESEDIDIALEEREIQSDQATETKNSLEVREIIDPKPPAVKEGNVIAIHEVKEKTVLKTKCQLIQEEIENGEKILSIIPRYIL